ncbi:SusC/RagA family TonB-linked outer membrane protein [Flavivirga spongiicola]|uniref:SusC/RagA family TonB-linked outer membrane protein n=1 Tax=Flavivirga spongiicola TaxID=421621 RepID=A0ABU7XSL4_9FLAO|nr:SusC/RagA family TonB-linked outer membrane protein [Flavivirga sp. MEBiC05379]MDO5978757.1 SusC/RagA family TonB-linked outer membrane protein [Flavivirga sp. MEBiC05379]
MKTKNKLLTLLLLLVTHVIFSQEKTISGSVVSASDNLSLPGVSVIIKNTAKGAQTDFNGEYSINVQSGQTLVFSFLGMKTQEVVVGNNTTINIVLEEDASVLNEVVIEGYRTVSKEKSVISSVQLTSEALEARPNASFVQSLSGQVAGLDIQTGSGQPGANSLVQIRGVSSINGNTEPLFLMDGIPINEDNFRSLNPNDIESISVIKDAAGSSVFGSRGANGVIVIKTKRGTKNSPLRIAYTGTQSYSLLQDHDYDFMSAPEYLRFERDVIGRGRGVGMTDAEIDATPTTNWEDVFFRTGTTQNHTLTFAQGGENTSSFTSLGYFNQEGILRTTGLKRFTFRNNLTGSSDNGKFNYNTSFTANYSKSNIPTGVGSFGVTTNLLYGVNASLPYISTDEYIDGATLANQGFSLALTPIYLLDRLRHYEFLEEEVKVIAGFSADYELTENLKAKINIGLDYEHTTGYEVVPPNAYRALVFAQPGNTTPGFQRQDTGRNFSFNNNLSLNYNKSFGKHTLDATLFSEYFRAFTRGFGYFARGLNPRNFAPGDDSAFISDNGDNDFFVDDANAFRLDAGLFSYFGNIDYDYDSKYGISATIRRDASYRFSATNRWGTFYSVGARWNISNEDFMQDSVFNDLKLRASYGTTGNQRINGGTYFSSPDLFQSFYATSSSGYGNANSLFLSQIGNNTLKWEEVTQTNIGIDFQVFNRRLRGSLDVYHKKTEDLFQFKQISAINGTTGIDSNVGDVINKGVDWALHYDLIKKKDLSLTLNFVGNYNDNELSNLPSETGEILGIGRNGGKIFEQKLIRYAGINPGNGNALFFDIDGNLTENPNPDTDAVWTGKNATPDATGSFGFNFNYKGFYLDTQWSYVIGVDRRDIIYYELINSGFALTNFQLSRDILNAWTPDNRITDIPSITATNGTSFRDTSDRFLSSSDYLRLRFLNIGYNFPKKHLKGTGITKLKLYGSAENLVTFSEWRGYDSESRVTETRQYPTPKILSFGIEIGF